VSGMVRIRPAETRALRQQRGGTSHVELDQEFAVYSLLRDGKVIRVQSSLSWREALEAAGLEA